jgi:hypothetical protein
MTDTKHLLERAARSAPDPSFELVDLHDRRRRRRGKDRILALGVGLALAAATLGLVLVVMRPHAGGVAGASGPTGASGSGITGGTGPAEGSGMVPGSLPPATRAPLVVARGRYSVQRVHLYENCDVPPEECWGGELWATWWWSQDGSGLIDVVIARGYGITEGRFGPGEFPNDNGIDVSGFPTDPVQLYDFLLARSQPDGASPAPLVSPPPDGAPQDGRMWRAITDLLEDPHVTPTVRAALLQVAAGLQGSHVMLDRIDPVGRPAYVIEMGSDDGSWIERLYVDPGSHDFLGSAWNRAGEDRPYKVWLVEMAGVADSAGEDPSETSIPDAAQISPTSSPTVEG